MKISIGANVVEGPWGGGNLFFRNFINYFNNLGNEVINDLSHDDIDIILLTDPRKDSVSSSFTHKDIEQYLKYVNNEALVVQRINECDERKSTQGLNDFYINANKVADHTIFVSSWISNIYKNLGINENKSSVFLGGGDSAVFNSENKIRWDKKEKVRLVTHHWSNNRNKGFEIYSQLDSILNKEPYKSNIEFTYIGNFPEGLKLENIKLIPPMYGDSLAGELKKYHIYVTASLNEPSGNHHIEAAQSRLPILYMDSGGIPEYCEGFGVSYNFENLEEKINELIDNYDDYFDKLLSYPFNNENLLAKYDELFQDMKKNRKELIGQRGNIKRTNQFNTFLFRGIFKLKKIINNIRN